MRGADTSPRCAADGGRSGEQQPAKQKSDACFLGMACRSAPAVAPALEPIQVTAVIVRLSQPILSEPAKPSGPLQQLFRPPRSI